VVCEKGNPVFLNRSVNARGLDRKLQRLFIIAKAMQSGASRWPHSLFCTG